MQVIDYGHPQSSSSEALKEFVLNQPILVKSHVRSPAELTSGCRRTKLRRAACDPVAV